jgi:hypothetical protein
MTLLAVTIAGADLELVPAPAARLSTETSPSLRIRSVERTSASWPVREVSVAVRRLRFEPSRMRVLAEPVTDTVSFVLPPWPTSR